MSTFICGSSRPPSEWDKRAFLPLKDWPNKKVTNQPKTKTKPRKPTPVVTRRTDEEPLVAPALNFGPDPAVKEDGDAPLVAPTLSFDRPGITNEERPTSPPVRKKGEEPLVIPATA
jgi:hypothetical protein